jgi:hypothetical protein
VTQQQQMKSLLLRTGQIFPTESCPWLDQMDFRPKIVLRTVLALQNSSKNRTLNTDRRFLKKCSSGSFGFAKGKAVRPTKENQL